MNKLPWDDISVPKSDFSVRLVAPSLSIPLYWGKDPHAHLLFIVELTGDHATEFEKNPLVIRGIAVDLRAGGAGSVQRLVLTLQQPEDADLFYSLCRTLAEALQPVSDPQVALAVTFRHLNRWKTFLAGRRAGLLTPEEVRGLFAELTVLRDLANSISLERAVTSWTGADRVKQDFVFIDVAVEVKSLSGKERNAVRISSEDQLEFPMGRLFLTALRLFEGSDDPASLSLNSLVSGIEVALTKADAIEEFQRKLAAAGYVPSVDYDEPRFIQGETRTYLVEDTFPKLVRSKLPQGIARVTYDLNLESIQPYQCARETIFGGTNGSDA